MPRKSHTITSTSSRAKSQPPVPALGESRLVNFEAPDPADLWAQKYRQSLPPHPAQFQPLRPPPPPPSISTHQLPRETSPPRPSRTLELRPLAEIGRHTSPSLKRLARNASSASTRTNRSLPKIDEVPDLDSDTHSINSVSHSRSSSSSSAASRIYPTSEEMTEYMKMDRREATIRASIERTSWMIDEDSGKGRGSRDLMEHINYVMSAWQREK